MLSIFVNFGMKLISEYDRCATLSLFVPMSISNFATLYSIGFLTQTQQSSQHQAQAPESHHYYPFRPPNLQLCHPSPCQTPSLHRRDAASYVNHLQLRCSQVGYLSAIWDRISLRLCAITVPRNSGVKSSCDVLGGAKASGKEHTIAFREPRR